MAAGFRNCQWLTELTAFGSALLLCISISPSLWGVLNLFLSWGFHVIPQSALSTDYIQSAGVEMIW